GGDPLAPPSPARRHRSPRLPGVAGMFLLDDERSGSVGLPDRYGGDDIPLIVQDRDFDGGRLVEPTGWLSGAGMLGDTIIVNGTRDPHVEVGRRLVRFRVVDGGNARFFTFAF